ncbi:oligogalacturonate-specific porin KdgM family protein, partial [Salmonella enterica]
MVKEVTDETGFPLAFSSYLQAATLDYRHEYADRTRINKDRIAIIEKLPNGIGFYV